MSVFRGAALLLALAGPLAAQSGPVRPANLTETAVRLATQGAAQREARTVMAAAHILRMVERGASRVQRLGEVRGPTGPWEGRLTSQALLRLAQRIALDRGDQATADYAGWLLQLPDSIPVTRGAVGGPVWAEDYLGPGEEIRYSIHFDGGQTPNLLQVAAGLTRAVFQCSLHPAADTARVAARERSLAGSCSLEWRQATAGRMTLRIRNGGPATYVLVSSN